MDKYKKIPRIPPCNDHHKKVLPIGKLHHCNTDDILISNMV